MKMLALLLLLALAACDKADETTGAGATTGESVEELLAKLPAESRGVSPAQPAADLPLVQTFGRFGTNGVVPSLDGDRPVEVDERAVSELNIVAAFRVESAFAERQIDPRESVIVQFGGEENDGLLVTIRYKKRSVSRSIVPATNGPELVSNLDHTVDRLLDELGVPRKR